VIKEDVSVVSTKDVCGIFVNARKELLVCFSGYCVDNPTTIPVELKHIAHAISFGKVYSTLGSLVVFWRV